MQPSSSLLYDAYAPWYDQQNQMEDLDFYLQVLEEFGGPVLEAGCGTGRLLIPIAREGYEILGFDLSAPMREQALNKLAKESPEVQQKAQVHYGDMREYHFPQQFKTIIFGCNTFQHLLSNEDQDKALQRASEHLHPEGRLFLQATLPRFFEVEPDVLVYRGRETNQGQVMDISYSYQYELDKQIQHLHLFLDCLDEEQNLKRQKMTVSLRYFFPLELERILALNDLRIEKLYGDFYGNPYTADSAWLIAQIEKVKSK